MVGRECEDIKVKGAREMLGRESERRVKIEVRVLTIVVVVILRVVTILLVRSLTIR